MKPKRLTTPLFVFDDYVDYLKAWFDYAKRFGFTQKDFIKKAGISAKSFLSDVLSQRKKIGDKHIPGFIEALELTDDEAEYFSLLVEKKNSHILSEINAIGGKLADLRSKKSSAILSGGGTLEYFSSWKYPVIREYIEAKGVVRSPDEICRSFLHLKLSLTETKQALRKLLKWNIIEFNETTGEYRPGNRRLITYSEIPHAVVNDVKRTFIESSIRAMENSDKDTRSISMAVRSMNRETYDRFCAKIDAIRKEFLETEMGTGRCEHVFTLQVQLFPIMKIDCESEVQREEQ